MKSKGYCIIFIIIIVLAVIVSTLPNSFSKKEGFVNILAEPGKYPNSDDGPILNSYKFTGRKTVNSNNYNNIWWNYPIFSLGSYAQVTNNLRYRKNPDDGVCITADFCGALYKDKQMKSNISKPLSPSPLVTPSTVRVNYYATSPNLFLGKQAGPNLPAF
jgi:hypothetical protein